MKIIKKDLLILENMWGEWINNTNFLNLLEVLLDL